MTKPIIIAFVASFVAIAVFGETNQKLPPGIMNTTNGPTKPGVISVQEMLVSGPPQLKMHSLSMISQGNIKDPVDESYLPGFKACAEDVSPPIRSIAAKLIGEFFVEGKETPNEEAMALLAKLAKDESSDVRYSAVYHGLSQIKEKSDQMIELLVDVAASNREQGLVDRISQSLQGNRDQVVQILDKKLAEEDNIAFFEIYEELAGSPPPNSDKYLDMPSSRTRMFVFKVVDDDAAAAKAALEEELKGVGITNPVVQISGSAQNFVLLVKTYITKEGMAVEKNFSKDGKFRITQQMWLAPELEIQFEAMRKASESKP